MRHVMSFVMLARFIFLSEFFCQRTSFVEAQYTIAACPLMSGPSEAPYAQTAEPKDPAVTASTTDNIIIFFNNLFFIDFSVSFKFISFYLSKK